MTKAYIYTRVSTLQQIDGFGIDRQINTLMDFLENAELPKELGYQLDPKNYEILDSDEGLSGYKGHNFTKGSLGKFKSRVANGEITSGCLLIESVDRFSRRQGYDAIDEFTILLKRNIDIIEVETEQIFSYRLDHKLTQLSTSIERAYQESKRKSRLITKSWANLKRKAVDEGIALKRNVPYWLALDGDHYQLKTSEAERIRSIFNDYANGKGVTAIVRDLNKAGGKYDEKAFSTNFINVMLRDRRLIGWLTGKRKKDETIADWKLREIKIYPEVIDANLFELVQRRIDANAVTKEVRSSSKQISLFNGVARCGICNEPLVGHFTQKGSYLRCLGKRSKLGTCNSSLIRYKECEFAVVSYVKNIDFKSIYGKNKNNTPAITSLQQRMAVIAAEIDGIESLLNTSDNSSEIVALTKARRERVKEKDKISYELTELMRTIDVSDEDFIVDLESICNQNNTELREKFNGALKKVIKSIKIIQDNGSDDKIFIIKFEYHSDYAMHYVALNLNGSLVAYSYIEDKGELCMKSSCMDINFKTGDITTKHVPNYIESLIVKSTLENVGQVLKEYNTGFDMPDIT
ncbi:recombinase family protein [Enterobacter ludwigii]|uniref:recombinase family protein n=1 Tax=Enterobacter ludwigii TaxID=299767 RepID=UPI003A7F7C85